MKRFYKMVTAVSAPEGFAIHLDGKPVRTPSGQRLIAPTQGIADLVVAEWAAQGDRIDPETMPLTQIVTTTKEHVGVSRAEMTRLVLAYLDTDLVCYRAAEPEALVSRQKEKQDAWLKWFAQRFAVELEITTGLAALRQPEAAHRAVQDCVAALDLWRFSVFQMTTAISGSLVLALAFVERAATAQQVFDAMHVEEHYRSDIYNEVLHGADPQQERAMIGKMRDLQALQKILDLCRG